jgi:hypothetical protein
LLSLLKIMYPTLVGVGRKVDHQEYLSPVTFPHRKKEVEEEEEEVEKEEKKRKKSVILFSFYFHSRKQKAVIYVTAGNRRLTNAYGGQTV